MHTFCFTESIRRVLPEPAGATMLTPVIVETEFPIWMTLAIASSARLNFVW
ncbi:hypothetical protein BO443_220029 [Burkholderia orbicola]